ncbi:nucleotidyltransferase family protein [Paracoccus sp. M683]|uniref:nucleotidyltransferase family protein n=1 Tax=Paracoccus sp. M683 TaxID=2594268 RepID=UPI00117F97B3|nr:nucleotidyltransferase family protein [Paracoccus sp. M683]TRW96740.1 nucleotidyltransferase family protein [Paracoccus sp. M683]
MPDNTHAETGTGLLLAAGASRRFGTGNKLLAALNGRPLIAHAAEALRALPLARRIAVISTAEIAPHLAGFQLIRIPQGEQSDSLRAGLAAAGLTDRLLITLGDMPLVTPDLLVRVLGRCTDALPAASRQGDGPAMPPACFPRSWLALLEGLTGDQGAGRLLRDLPDAQIIQAGDQLTDIDTQDALARLQG